MDSLCYNDITLHVVTYINNLIAFSLQTTANWKLKRSCFISIQKKKMVIFQCFYIFDKGNQSESKKDKLLENRFPFTKTHFQDSLFRINRPEVFFTENNKRTFDFTENGSFQMHMLKIRRWKKKTMKNIPSDHLVRPTSRTSSFFNCRLCVSCTYDTLLI